MDGVLADFGAAFHEVESRLFGPGVTLSEGQPEQEEENQEHAEEAELRSQAEAIEDAKAARQAAREARRRRDLIWQTIQATPNFWQRLKAIDPAAVPRIHALMLRYRWEVFFITQRPKTEGETVQRQTQQWLV